MKFNPEICIGAELSNGELREVFQCGNMGGMRRSKRTGTRQSGWRRMRYTVLHGYRQIKNCLKE